MMIEICRQKAQGPGGYASCKSLLAQSGNQYLDRQVMLLYAVGSTLSLLWCCRGQGIILEAGGAPPSLCFAACVIPRL